ncbi:MAG TPA: hypothetical protein PLX12_00560 [Flexilinea sp.]|nr:hypothetical protein [Flexilinea sp.]HPL56824.1 hypothetical protein [Flexilinea sp.]HQJ00075.1 hypothetical protein [Flexilinea sp.]
MINTSITFSIAGIVLFIVSCIAIIMGIIIIISSVFSKNAQEIQKQAAKLSSKGFTDEMSGALGNASTLIRELNTLIETKRGVGLSLVLIGFILAALCYLFLL